jgi:hypothetical protein
MTDLRKRLLIVDDDSEYLTALDVQFHDILYTLSLDMLYTSGRARASVEV